MTSRFLRAALLLIAAMLLMTSAYALAECPVTLAEPLTGVHTWPEGASETEAQYVYRYSYPQIAGNSDLAMHINATYTYAVEDALAFEVPMLASGMSPDDPQKVVDVSYEVTCMNADYLSVRIIKRVTVAGERVEVVTGHVFALTGSGAGRVTNLPVFIGLLDADETDDWLMTRQTNKADDLVRRLVWDEILATDVCWDDLTFEELEDSFYPEEDFYLTVDGDVCFYFQPGLIAPEEEGLMTFTFPLWLLQDEL